MIVLRRKAVDQDRAAVERFSKVVGTQQSGDGKAKSFDPVLGCEVDGWESCQSTIGNTADYFIVVGLCDRTSRL